MPGRDNVVGLASLRPDLRARVAASAPPQLAAYDVDLANMAHAPHDTVAADASAILTDDFPPTEYLNRD